MPSRSVEASRCSGRRNVAAPALACLLLAACTPEPTATQQAEQDARAIAQVEAIQRQKPPPRPIAPLPIMFDDIQKHDLYGAGCAFAPGGSMGAVLLAQDKAGYMKLGSGLVRLASDPGSTRLPPGAWSRYTGKEFSASLTRVRERGEANGNESLRWPGHLTVTNAFEQVVYDADGEVQCSA